MPVPRRPWRQAPRRDGASELLRSSRSWTQQTPHDFLVRTNGSAQLIDVDKLVRGMGDVNRSRTEQQRRAPAVEQRDVRRICDRCDLEAVDRVKMLRRNV